MALSKWLQLPAGSAGCREVSPIFTVRCASRPVGKQVQSLRGLRTLEQLLDPVTVRTVPPEASKLSRTCGWVGFSGPLGWPLCICPSVGEAICLLGSLSHLLRSVGSSIPLLFPFPFTCPCPSFLHVAPQTVMFFPITEVGSPVCSPYRPRTHTLYPGWP
jgi:hypothetical protein